MKTRTVTACALVLLTTPLILADGSYQSTSQMTGGALVDQLQSSPLTASLTKGMLSPTNTLTMVHGNLKAVVTKASTEIIDLDKETVTRLDTVKKTYTVITFAQVRQAMANMPQQMQQAQAQMKQLQEQQSKSTLQPTFDVSVKDGPTKAINGLTAQEHILTLQMHVTDSAAAAAGPVTYTVTTDVWIAPDPPEVKEIQAFDLRMGQKMSAGTDISAFMGRGGGGGNAGMAALFGGRPGAAQAMAQMGTEMAKLKGTHVLEVTTMGGSGPAASPGGGASAAAGAPTTAGATLMQMSVEKTNFSSDPIPASVFQIPAGFTNVPSPFGRSGGR
jgi:hypothetical protein